MSGIVLPGSFLYFYLTNTTTPADTYTTSARNVAHPNPLEADIGGRFDTIYLDPDVIYKAELRNAAGVVQWTLDPVNDQLLSAAVIGSYLYPRTTAEIAAAVTPSDYSVPSHETAGCIHPHRYSANDDTAIANALTVSNQLGGGVVQLLAKSYTITSKKTIPTGTTLRGAGIEGTVINVSGAIVGFSQEQVSHIATNGKSVVEHIHFVGNGTALGALLFENVNNVEIFHCQFTGFTSASGYGIRLIEVYFWEVSWCLFEDIGKYGIHGTAGSTSGPNAGTIGPRNDFIGNNQAAFVGVSITAQNIHIFDNDFEGANNGLNGIELIGCEGIQIDNNYIELWDGPAIKINSGAATSRVLVQQNVIHSNNNPVCDIDNSNTNDNIAFIQNRFADISGGVTCIDVGSTTRFVEYSNDPASGNITDTYTTSQLATTRAVRTETGTLTGIDSVQTGTLRLERIGNSVTVYVPGITGTSNTNACTITGGVPSIFYPARNQSVVGARYVDNGVSNCGIVSVSTVGVLTLSNFAGSNTFFTGSGTKGTEAFTFTYSMN